jgi:hypothetical protein
MSAILSPSSEMQNLDLEVIVSEDDKTVYVKLTGFSNLEDADNYAVFLTDNLPLMLFETDVIH